MAERPRCAMCDKLIRPWTKHVRAPTEPKTHRPIAGWKYDGNLQIVAREYAHMLINPANEREWVYQDGYREYDNSYYADWVSEKRLSGVRVWDGESYLPRNGFFCSNTCAGDFARAAYKAGYRIKQRSAA